MTERKPILGERGRLTGRTKIVDGKELHEARFDSDGRTGWFDISHWPRPTGGWYFDNKREQN